MEITGTAWFTSADGTVGIVRALTEWNEVEYYISSVRGHNEQEDSYHIRDWGARFPKEAGDALFEHKEV